MVVYEISPPLNLESQDNMTSPLKPLVRLIMKVGYNDHLVVGIRIYTRKGYYNDSGPCWNMYKKHNVQVTVKASCLIR